jgi:hypothetical protein
MSSVKGKNEVSRNLGISAKFHGNDYDDDDGTENSPPPSLNLSDLIHEDMNVGDNNDYV